VQSLWTSFLKKPVPPWWCVWAGLALLSFCGTALTQAQEGAAPGLPAADQEPITPIPPPPAADPLKLALGERLFEDPRLSKDNSQACSSCHDVRSNGASPHQHDRAPGGSELPFNTSTIFNAALSFRLNWEGNFRSFEAHASASLEPAGMETILARLRADQKTTHQFEEVYGHGPDRESLFDAIATYERSLVTPGSRFDQWLNGDASAVSAEEQTGYRLFKSLGCISCHQGVNVGGNLFQRHGIFHPLASPKPEILRVPSLRNVAATPPYFHDGSAPTMGDAVRRMGLAQLNRRLSDEQVEAITAFLRTLSGTYRGKPVVAASP
jgi:cytochrome c peroxidase